MKQNDLKNLKNIFGFDHYKPGQQNIINEILDGKDVLTVMPTGGGKSLCYQLPSTLFDGLTIVVSPLIALMQSQVSQLRLLGIKAASLNSSNSNEENKETWELLNSNELKMLYVAPERLIKQETLELLKSKNISLLAIDEAHCVSQWGHDFRKEHLKLGDVRKELSMVQTIALTATADETTRKDIIDKIFPNKPKIFIEGFDRPNIYLSMLPKNNAKKQILSFIEPMRGQTGIIYCSTRKKAEEWAEFFIANKFRALPYHAGMSAEDRKINLETFIEEEGIVITATIAFGLGIDPSIVTRTAKAIIGCYRIFSELDATMVEINPLVISKDKDVLALDCKMSFANNALFRRNNNSELRDKSQENQNEVYAADRGLNYVGLEGNIGNIINGAGLAMASMDMIKLAGGEPANFLDVGGGATPEKIVKAFKLISSDSKVKVILVNIFAGINRCDWVAEGIVLALQKIKIDMPLIIRLAGTNVDEGNKILMNSGIDYISATTLEDAANKAVEALNKLENKT